MRYSRTGIVAVLLAAEVFIGGAILWTLRGGHWMWPAQAAGLHHVSQGGRTFAPIDAGDAPHVVIDDPDTHIVISPSTDGKVHVVDDTHTVGWVWGTPASTTVSVAKTADGVSITRRGAEEIAVIGLDFQHTDVQVPPGAFVDVQRCGGADLNGLAGQVRVHSVDGSIKGRELRITGGRIDTDEGRVRLAFASANLNVHASAQDGSIRLDGKRLVRDEDLDTAVASVQIGTGGEPLDVSSKDGSIYITTNGAL